MRNVKSMIAGVVGTMLVGACAPGPGTSDASDCVGTVVDSAPGDASVEYTTFDNGICAGLCLRLQECGELCRALGPAPAGCTNESPAAFEQCLHGGIDQAVFGIGTCPHACRSGFVFTGATDCALTSCRDSIRSRSCDLASPGGIGQLFLDVGAACGVCSR